MSGRRAVTDLGVAPEFLINPTTLDELSPSGDRGGMVLGSGPRGEPLSLSLLRNAPTRVISLGGLYLARQITLRAMAMGARIVIATGRPQAWQLLVNAAGQQPDPRAPLIQIRRLSQLDLPRASEGSPLLVVNDGGAVPQELFPTQTPWQTVLYVLPYLHPQATATVNSADLILAQRQSEEQSRVAARIWQLAPQAAHLLTTLSDDGVIAFGLGFWQPLRLVTTAKEQVILGPVRRGD